MEEIDNIWPFNFDPPKMIIRHVQRLYNSHKWSNGTPLNCHCGSLRKIPIEHLGEYLAEK